MNLDINCDLPLLRMRRVTKKKIVEVYSPTTLKNDKDEELSLIVETIGEEGGNLSGTMIAHNLLTKVDQLVLPDLSKPTPKCTSTRKKPRSHLKKTTPQPP